MPRSRTHAHAHSPATLRWKSTIVSDNEASPAPAPGPRAMAKALAVWGMSVGCTSNARAVGRDAGSCEPVSESLIVVTWFANARGLFDSRSICHDINA